ncbi:TauD/TfdA dioxygenase family protein [Nocardia sp. NPDC058499]|uniref:TauD/TfdA dioxygenase family protein n=1 Tax=Nocardia sp. NPDC058499 TaxID=3346530 RepID=UPI003665D3E0
MPAVATRELSEKVGVEVLDVDAERLTADPDLPHICHDLLERYGVVLFRELHATDAAQVEFGAKLGELAIFPQFTNKHVMEISFDPANPLAPYFPSNDYWHIDGCLDRMIAKTSIMSARVTAAHGGETAFASTYVAYDELSEREKEELADIRVVHKMARVQRLSHPDPTPEQIADWERLPARVHPLVWQHESGRRSLVFGATAAYIDGSDPANGRQLLDDLEHRATTPDRVYTHTWSVGDMVLWDNTGLMHRACEFDRSEPRRMARSTVLGSEPIA